MSTMTTVGYGTIAPQAWYTLMIATVQAALSILVFVILLSLCVGLLSKPFNEGEGADEQAGGHDDAKDCCNYLGFGFAFTALAVVVGLAS